MKIKINIFATYFSVKMKPNGMISNDPIIYIKKFVRNKLTEYGYSDKAKGFVPIYNYVSYDKDNEMLSIPINLLSYFNQYILSNNGSYEIIEHEPDESDDINLSVKSHYKDRDNQSKVIDFFAHGTNKMRALRLQTGNGKTYCAIKASIIIGKRILVILPSFLINQWIEEFLAISNIKKDEITLIQGAKSIEAIINNDEIIKQTKVFIVSAKTLVQYAKKSFESYKHIIPCKEFITKLRVGTKIVDECHLHFYGNTIIDLHCNIANNLYLSASYIRSNKSGNRIFNWVFPEFIKFDDKSYNRYTNITECLYSLGFIHPMTTKTKRGYSQIKYEKYLSKQEVKLRILFEQVFTKLIEDYYLNIRSPKQKLLIFIATRDIGYKLCNFLKKEYPKVKISVYFNDTDDIVLKKSEIIISTTGSCGVGKDIENLRTVILFPSFMSEGLCYQTLGRLRKLKNGDVPEFIFMQNKAIESHLYHLKTRRLLYQSLCKKYNSIEFMPLPLRSN